MPSRDASFVKSQRLQEINRKMKESIKEDIVLDKLLDWIEINIGLTRTRAKEYVNLICRGNDWVLDGETIKWKI